MNNYLYATKLLMTTVMLSLATLVSAASYFNMEDDRIVEQRVYNLNTVVDVAYTKQVSKNIYFYVEKHKHISEVLLGRVNIYFPLFENVLREKGLPESLKYLPIIESGLRPSITSHAGAAGLWQFMKPTARMLDLKINRTIDERRDPMKSTYAAAEYLEFLYNKYEDWTLALAAYNCGPGNVNKAIRRSGSKDFWKLQKYLPRETRNYIPKFIAASYLMNYYHEHNIVPQEPESELIFTGTAKVYEKINFKELAKQYELDLDLLKKLNPAYLRNYIPKNEDGKYTITLPEKNLFEYLDNNGSYDDIVYVPYSKKLEKENREVEALEKLPSIFTLKRFTLDIDRNSIQEEKKTRLRRGQTYSSISEADSAITLDKLIAINSRKKLKKISKKK